MNIEGCQIGPGATAGVFLFNASALARTRGQGRMLAEARLDAGFLVGTGDELVGLKRLPVPLSGVEVEDTPSLGGEIWVTREYPAAMLPRADGVFVEPPPDCLVADGGHDAAALGLAHNVCSAQAGERKTQRGGQLTGNGLNLHYDLRGEKPGGGPDVVAPPGLAGDGERSVCAKD